MERGDRGRRALAIAAMMIAVAIAVPRFLTHTPYQRFGVRLDWKATDGLVRVDDVIAPPGRGVLEPGDLILEVQGRPMDQATMREQQMRGGWPRGPIVMRIERDGIERMVVLPPLQIGAWQRIRLFTLPLVAVVAAPLVAFLLVWRRPDLTTAWVFLWFAVLQGLGVIWGLFR
ncbi:MAG: hypothetical protein ACRDF6_13660, partial [bacterium]